MALTYAMLGGVLVTIAMQQSAAFSRHKMELSGEKEEIKNPGKTFEKKNNSFCSEIHTMKIPIGLEFRNDIANATDWCALRPGCVAVQDYSCNGKNMKACMRKRERDDGYVVPGVGGCTYKKLR